MKCRAITLASPGRFSPVAGVKNHLSEGLSFKIEKSSVNNIKTEDLNSDQIFRLLKAIKKSSRAYAVKIMKLALHTGMRRDEMFKLQYDDIDFDRGYITLRDPKGGPDQKILPKDAARELLENHPKSDSP